MAFKHCIHCKKPISKQASTCTHCGHPQKTKKCIECGEDIGTRRKKCPECGASQYPQGRANETRTISNQNPTRYNPKDHERTTISLRIIGVAILILLGIGGFVVVNEMGLLSSEENSETLDWIHIPEGTYTRVKKRQDGKLIEQIGGHISRLAGCGELYAAVGGKFTVIGNRIRTQVVTNVREYAILEKEGVGWYYLEIPNIDGDGAIFIEFRHTTDDRLIFVCNAKEKMEYRRMR